MGFFDKAKEFAGKKIEEYKAEKAKSDYKRDFQQKVEKYQYEKAYQKSRMSALAQKARKDARASVFPHKGSAPQRSFLANIGENSLAAGQMFSGGGLGSGTKKKGKAYRPVNLDSVDFDTMGMGAMLKKRR